MIKQKIKTEILNGISEKDDLIIFHISFEVRYQ